MHPNPAFRTASTDRNLAFARGRGFGTLCVNGFEGPLLAHVPFILDADGRAADLHLARSNPILRALDKPAPALIAVAGPDGYISPDWYGLTDQVPTWNYVAVHLRGRLERRPEEALRPHLEALSAAFEARLAPKAPWKVGKMSEGALEWMMRAIVPCRLIIAEVQGTWKFGQNKAAAARKGAAAGVAAAGIGQETGALARFMADWPEV